MREEQKRQIREHLEAFLKRRAATIAELHLDDLNINPFMIRLLSHELNLNDAKSIVEWFLDERMQRGIVTAFGRCLQDIATIFAQGTGVEGADMIKIKDNIPYYIQLKSGPNPLDKDACVKATELLLSAQRRHPGSVALFAMSYGHPSQISSQVKKYIGVQTMIGQQFWEFISNDPDCAQEIYEVAARVSTTFRFRQWTLSQLIENKLVELTQAFVDRYGDSDSQMWENLLKENI